MFCPACAATIEPGAAFCPSCGEAVSPAPLHVVATPVTPVTAGVMPAAVKTAVTLLWASIAVNILTLAVSMITLQARLPQMPRFLAFFGVILALWVLAIVFTTRGANLGRYLVFLLVAYSVFTLLIRSRSLIMYGNPAALVALLELALRLWAVWLLLKPESSAWFAYRASPARP